MNKGISISNIAWLPEEDKQVRDILVNQGIKAVEVTPARAVKDLDGFTNKEINLYKQFWNEADIEISSMQALLYGGPGGNIFGSEYERNLVGKHLDKVFQIASELEAKHLVFGSPKNRKKGNLIDQVSHAIAVDFFFEMGEKCVEYGIKLCIEPNPNYYGCDFVTTSDEAVALVDAVNSKGFGVHLDAAGLFLSNENIEQKIKEYASIYSHFHISEKDLATVGMGSTPHEIVSDAIRNSDYSGWLSIEMLRSNSGLSSITEALNFVKETYQC